jgi:hypothetical protein
MQAPPIDKRSTAEIVAWTEQLARAERAAPGPGLTGAVLERDLVDPGTADRVVALAGTTVDGELVATLGGLAWLDVASLLHGTTLREDIDNPATRSVHRVGTVVDTRLALVLADVARVCGAAVLVGNVVGQDVDDPVDRHTYPAGTVVDAALAAVIERRAWVTVRSWQPRSDGAPDAGRALIGVFGRFASLVIERLNRAPEKHELAFLNLTGTQLLPPRPARVPLTFVLATSSPVDAAVPAGTQVTAAPLDGEEDEVVFETERSLVVTRSQLQAVFVGDAETDSYRDRKDEATGLVDRPFDAFGGDQPTPHQLYLACDELLTPPGTKDVVLRLRTPDAWPSTNWPISWSYHDGETPGSWKAVASTATVANGIWRVGLSQLPPLVASAVNERQAGWLRAQLDMALPPGRSGLAPESVAVGNRQPQDLDLPLAPFGDTTPAKWFYLSADEAIGNGRALVRFRVTLGPGGAGPAVKLNWTYRVGNEWRVLGQSTAGGAQPAGGELQFSDGTRAFTSDGEISFRVPPEWPRELYRSRMGRWLRVEVADDGGTYGTLPRITALDVGYDWQLPSLTGISVQLNRSPEAQAPTAGAFDTTPLDLTKDFYPFGEQPRFNDTLHLALPDGLARPRATIRMKVTLTNPPGTVSPPGVFTQGKPQLAWEAWDGRMWRPVPVDDRTRAFTASGDVTVTLPDTVATTEVNGVEGSWLRVRLVSGDYGAAATYTTAKDKQDNTIYPPVPATYAPPVVKSVTLEQVGAAQPEARASACLTYNDFTYVDRTAVASGGAGQPFAPFTPAAERDPALYLGFDQPFDPQPTTLYLRVEPPLPEDVAADQLAEIDPTTLAQLTWEYAGPDGWRPLGALDETQTLASSGLVSFVGPRDLTKRSCFGQSSYWLRLRWRRGYFPLPPRLRRVLLNTTWAAQVTSVEDEILGSSNGHAHQVFTTAQTPVQPGQRVMVREREQPTPAEWAELVALEGPDAVDVRRDAAGQPDEIWVRWHAVPDLYESGRRDRHYTIDALTGEIRFGDGRYGLVPPVGQNNIRTGYRTGGGEAGNRAAEAVVQMKSSVPYVDGVTNHEPAQGGAPREPIERLKERGPRFLRHRDRAVTAQDVEDLAYAASTTVARAVAVAPDFDAYNLWLEPAGTVSEEHRDAYAGRMGVIVVPTTEGARPTPTLGLLRQVQAHLAERCPPTADLWVAGPEWVRVTVTVTVVPTSVEAANAVAARARTALERFLHPLTGGPLGQGWAFGRKPHRSDLFTLAEAVGGVDHLESLTVAHEPETQDANRQLDLERVLDRPLSPAGNQATEPALRRWLARALVYSGQHQITVVLPR